MKIYLGFDDTDTAGGEYGTGKLVRWFQDALPERCRCLGVVRQQLLVCDQIPYTSHNSAACFIAELPDAVLLDDLIRRAIRHLEAHALPGSDPGMCVVAESAPSLQALMDFGYTCTHAVVTQKEALAAAGGAHLSSHGGSNDGIIGAAAAVGLTASGWAGRFIELEDLRRLPAEVAVSDLTRMGIQVVATERDGEVPAPGDIVATNAWLRPRLLGHRPVLLVGADGTGRWRHNHSKRGKDQEISS
jgi:tRNA(Ile2) C34 agmatinyltransferase TiaS